MRISPTIRASWQNCNNSHTSNSALCKRLEMPFKKQSRNLLPQTKPLMKWGCSAPTHSLTSNTHISDVIWGLLPLSFLAQSITCVTAIKNRGIAPIFPAGKSVTISTHAWIFEVSKCQNTHVFRHPNNASH